MNFIKNMITNIDSREGKYFNLFIHFLIIVSIIDFSIETIPNLNEETYFILNVLEYIITITFTIEYILRLIFLQKRKIIFLAFMELSI